MINTMDHDQISMTVVYGFIMTTIRIGKEMSEID